MGTFPLMGSFTFADKLRWPLDSLRSQFGIDVGRLLESPPYPLTVSMVSTPDPQGPM